MSKRLSLDHPAIATRNETASETDRGAAAREHLVAAATRIFAVKGYAGASTREICEAAGVNVASIHYYFGDKEGLYRAVLMRPLAEMTAGFRRFDDPALPFEDAIRMFLTPLLGVLAGNNPDDLDAHVMRLHLRETLEPTPAFRELVAQLIVPVHRALTALLARHCGLQAPDTDIAQLSFAIIATANDYCLSREFMKMLAPEVLERPQAERHILDRLVGYSRALVEHEQARRAAARPATPAMKDRNHALRSRPGRRR